MQNELEYALSEGRWGEAARNLERLDGDTAITDIFARKALAALLREQDRKDVGQPRKILPNDQPSIWEVVVIKELQSLSAASGQKEAEKVEIAKKYGIGRSSLEALEKKYRDYFPQLLD